jgi:hypothetical protein
MWCEFRGLALIFLGLNGVFRSLLVNLRRVKCKENPKIGSGGDVKWEYLVYEETIVCFGLKFVILLRCLLSSKYDNNTIFQGLVPQRLFLVQERQV